STASSAQKSTATSTRPGRHVNSSEKSMSGATSLSRMKLMKKEPEVVAQDDASTVSTAVHVRCCSCISENRVSLKVSSGWHEVCPAAGAKPNTARAQADSPDQSDRRIGGSPSGSRL